MWTTSARWWEGRRGVARGKNVEGGRGRRGAGQRGGPMMKKVSMAKMTDPRA